MLSRKGRQSKANQEPQSTGGPLPIPGIVNELSPVEQLSFPDTAPIPFGQSQPSDSQQSFRSMQAGAGNTPVPEVSDQVTGKVSVPELSRLMAANPSMSGVSLPTLQQTPLPDMASQVPPATPLPGVTQQLPGSAVNPQTTQQLRGLTLIPTVTVPLSDTNATPSTRLLPELHTGALIPVRNTTTSLRAPVIIKSTGKKSTGIARPPVGRRWVVHLLVTLLLIVIASGTLMAVLPVGTNANGGPGFNPFRPISQMFQGQSNDGGLSLAQQAATVTAVTRDGYDPNGGTANHTNQPPAPGLPAPPPGSGAGDNFTYGQCTYWADLRYHQLTGYWVAWGGNAWQWEAGARASGWIVSSTPHVPSIIVLQPGVQGAGGYGHVAVVESINANGSAHTSNWNWYANGGGWARLSYWDFYPGSGVSFVWHP